MVQFVGGVACRTTVDGSGQRDDHRPSSLVHSLGTAVLGTYQNVALHC